MATAPRADASLALEVAPVPLDASDPSRAAVGPLRYLGGLWLSSADPRFGGLSDLRVSPDGARLFAVSDCGYGFTASLSYDAGGRLTGVADARLVELAGPAGGPLGMGETDAESLVAGRAGWRWGSRAGRGCRPTPRTPPFGGPARPLPVARRAWATCGRNGGLETMADTARRAAAARVRGAAGGVEHRAGLGRARRGAGRPREYPLAFDGGWAGEPFRPDRRRAAARRRPARRRAPLPADRRAARPPAAGEPRGRGAARAARDRPLREPAHARQLRGGGGAPRRLRPDAGLPALRRQRLREDARARSGSGLQRTLLLLFALEG